jgi:tetratricopeptide (TPR) repeat protein
VKVKCPKCSNGKARRICHREGGAEICSVCCASIRSSECGNCPHYELTSNYEARRANSTGVFPDGKFLAEYNPLVTTAVNKALENAEHGNTQKAIGILTELLRDHPRSYEVAFGIGCVHAHLDEHEKAVEWFDKAIAIYPYTIESYYNKAVAHQMMMQIPECIRAYQKVVAMGEPADREVVASRSFLADAASTIRTTSGIFLDEYMEAMNYFDRGFALMNTGDWQNAVEMFLASSAINHNNPACHGNMGLCLAYLGRKSEALSELDRALEIDPDYLPARDNREIIRKLEEGTAMAKVEYKTVNYGLEEFKRRH